MNAVGSRHMFWQAPRAPLLSNGPFRTIPLRMSGRPVFTGGIFLSQAPGNRLNGISISAIIGRIQIQPVIQAVIEGIKNPPPPDPNAKRYGNWGQQMEAQEFQGNPLPNFPPMTDVEKQTLIEISQNPTDEELKDLTTIDSVFSQDFEGNGYSTTLEVCYLISADRPIYWGRTGGLYLNVPYRGVSLKVIDPNGQAKDRGLVHLIYNLMHPLEQFSYLNYRGGQAKNPMDLSFKDDKFYCTDTKSWGSDTPISTMFGIDSKRTWGEVKQAVQNALIIVDVHSKYPFPPPVDTRPELFWKYASKDLPKMANISGRVDPEAVRFWMTLAALQYYDAMSTQIQQEAAAAAAAARRRGWLISIISLIASIIVPFLLPAVLVSAIAVIKTVITTIIDVNQRKAAAKALADTSKLFAKDAPAFAAEVQKTADMMDSQAAQEQASKPLTPEQQSIVDGIAQSMPSTPVGTYVAGGVVGVGAIAALIALLR
jgi:hypothetical protein